MGGSASFGACSSCPNANCEVASTNSKLLLAIVVRDENRRTDLESITAIVSEVGVYELLHREVETIEVRKLLEVRADQGEEQCRRQEHVANGFLWAWRPIEKQSYPQLEGRHVRSAKC